MKDLFELNFYYYNLFPCDMATEKQKESLRELAIQKKTIFYPFDIIEAKINLLKIDVAVVNNHPEEFPSELKKQIDKYNVRVGDHLLFYIIQEIQDFYRQAFKRLENPPAFPESAEIIRELRDKNISHLKAKDISEIATLCLELEERHGYEKIYFDWVDFRNKLYKLIKEEYDWIKSHFDEIHKKMYLHERGGSCSSRSEILFFFFRHSGKNAKMERYDRNDEKNLKMISGETHYPSHVVVVIEDWVLDPNLNKIMDREDYLNRLQEINENQIKYEEYTPREAKTHLKGLVSERGLSSKFQKALNWAKNNWKK